MFRTSLALDIVENQNHKSPHNFRVAALPKEKQKTNKKQLSAREGAVPVVRLCGYLPQHPHKHSRSTPILESLNPDP